MSAIKDSEFLFYAQKKNSDILIIAQKDCDSFILR